MRFLTAIPVYNEAAHLEEVLSATRPFAHEILVVDDGSSDGTHRILESTTGIQVITHDTNQGYGAALRDAFAYAVEHDFEFLVTLDCDGQHEPRRIPDLLAVADADIVSGSRYLERFD